MAQDGVLYILYADTLELLGVDDAMRIGEDVFRTPGSPGGLGVREVILVAALGPIYGAGPAFALALVLRVCNLAADGLGFVAGLALRRSLAQS